MRRDLIGFVVRVLTLPTAGLLVVVALAPGRLPLAVHVYALVVSAVALGVGLALLRKSYPPAGPLRPRPPLEHSRRRPPATLARLEDDTALGVAGAFDFHYRLAPRLRALAAGLLTSRRRVSLDGSPDEARRALGDETWGLVRTDRPPPEDRLARGVAPAALARVVDSLERV